MKKEKNRKNRIFELDVLRGLSILLVVVDHLMVDFYAVFGTQWLASGNEFLIRLFEIGEIYCHSWTRSIWRPSFLFIFFSLSGLCTAFSRNNFVRGLKLSAVAIAISLVTEIGSSIFNSDMFILFGVVHCFAVIMLIFATIQFLLQKLLNSFLKENTTKYICSVIYLILGIVFLIIHINFNISLYDFNEYGMCFFTDSKLLGMFFFASNWWTLDYFPLFPFISFFFLGAGLSHLIYKNKKSLFASIDDGVWHLPLSIPGRYSIIFYLVGQVLALSFCLLVTLILA